MTRVRPLHVPSRGACGGDSDPISCRRCVRDQGRRVLPAALMEVVSTPTSLGGRGREGAGHIVPLSVVSRSSARKRAPRFGLAQSRSEVYKLGASRAVARLARH